jgi:hypothetical protein
MTQLDGTGTPPIDQESGDGELPGSAPTQQGLEAFQDSPYPHEARFFRICPRSFCDNGEGWERECYRSGLTLRSVGTRRRQRLVWCA